jgi:hypothetical protein
MQQLNALSNPKMRYILKSDGKSSTFYKGNPKAEHGHQKKKTSTEHID